MRVEVRVVLFGMVFVGGLALIYWLTSYEDAGTVLLVLGAGMYAILTGYLYLQSRRLRQAPPRPEAEDDKKIYDYNYEAVKASISRALKGEPSIDKVLADTPAARHPFAGGAED